MAIKEIIQRIVRDEIKTQVLVGKVISINETKMICDIDLQNAPDLLDVRLRAIIDSNQKGVLIVPKKGSYVLVGLIDNKKESAFICGYSEVDKVKILCENIELGGNNLGGLIKINELKTQLEKNNNLLSSILKVINGSPITEPGNGSPSALQIAFKSSLIGKTTGDFSNIENTKVKHG